MVYDEYIDTPVGTATWDLLRYRGPVAGHTSALWRNPDRHKPRHMGSGSIDGAGVGEDDGGGDVGRARKWSLVCVSVGVDKISIPYHSILG